MQHLYGVQSSANTNTSATNKTAANFFGLCVCLSTSANATAFWINTHRVVNDFSQDHVEFGEQLYNFPVGTIRDSSQVYNF
jgi:hypothetical protein